VVAVAVEVSTAVEVLEVLELPQPHQLQHYLVMQLKETNFLVPFLC
jgi:hypothetical protein